MQPQVVLPGLTRIIMSMLLVYREQHFSMHEKHCHYFLCWCIVILDLEGEQVFVVSSCLGKAAKHCEELLLESPEFPVTEWDKYD